MCHRTRKLTNGALCSINIIQFPRRLTNGESSVITHSSINWTSYPVTFINVKNLGYLERSSLPIDFNNTFIYLKVGNDRKYKKLYYNESINIIFKKK